MSAQGLPEQASSWLHPLSAEHVNALSFLPRAGAAFTGLLFGDLFKSCKTGSEISEILFPLLLCHCGGGAKQ